MFLVGCSNRIVCGRLSYDLLHKTIVVERNVLLSTKKRVVGYDEQGHLSYKGQFRDTTTVGRWRHFNDNGLLVAQFQYENGILVKSLLINRGDMWAPE